MNRDGALERLKFLYDQVHQTAERKEHLPERLPLDIHPASLNYGKDLRRLKGEYNRLARQVQEEGILSPEALESEGLPLHMEQDRGSGGGEVRPRFPVAQPAHPK